MRGFATYLLAGMAVVLAMDFLAPPVGIRPSLGAWPAVPADATIQSVDRTHKGDRLVVPATIIGKQQGADEPRKPRKPDRLLAGCDPVFSPLSASAYANFPRRCAT